MVSKYWVQVAYQRKPFGVAPKEPPKPQPAQPEQPAKESDPTPSPETAILMPTGNGEGSPKVRPVTREQEEAELSAMRSSDHPRVRQIFDLIDAPAKGKPIPEGVRLSQGDLVAPGLILEEDPFPSWLHDYMLRNGWTYDERTASFMLLVCETEVQTVENEQPVTRRLSAKAHAVLWYNWAMEILQSEAEHAAQNNRKALRENVGVYIREDHTDMLEAMLQQM